MTKFEDHFSGHAGDYARYRPGYPEGLFEELARRAPDRERAWDVGTGNGQVARGLASWFREVVATDASAEQLSHAEARPGVRFVHARAEQSGLEPGSVSLVACGVSIHWFSLDDFYREVRRVAKPGALVAAWSYWCRPGIGPEVDEAVLHLGDTVLEADWPEGIRYPRSRYRDLPFPFREETPPEVVLRFQWSVDDLLGWLRTWSAWRPHVARTGRDPLVDLERDLRRWWPDPEGGPVEARMPIFFRLGRVD